jgi:hypothetical protein
MIPFLSSTDALWAATVVAALVGLGVAVYLLARWQRPARQPITVEPLAVPAGQEAQSQAAAA